MNKSDKQSTVASEDLILQRQARNRSLTINAFGSFVIKGAAMLVSLCAMPVYMRFFGDESVLGVWFTLLSILNWILMFDFGIGNGLRNKLAISFAYNNKSEVCRLISSSYVLLGIISIVGFILSAFLVRQINWNTVFGISIDSLSDSDLLESMLVIFSAIWLQFYLKLITGILFAMQKAMMPSLLTLITNILVLLSALIYRPSSSSGALLYLSVTYAFASIVPLLITTAIVFRRFLPYYTFCMAECSLRYAKEVSGIGIHFFVLQILSMAVFNSREVLISNLVGSGYVVEYTVYFKVYSLISTFYLLALTPFWSAITEAFARRDFSWIKNTYLKGLFALALFAGIGVILLVAFPFVVRLWLGEAAPEPDVYTGILFLLFNLEYMYINLNAHVENGTERLRIQTFGYLLASVLLIVFSLAIANIFPSWNSIVLANVLALIPMGIMQGIEIKRTFFEWQQSK